MLVKKNNKKERAENPPPISFYAPLSAISSQTRPMLNAS